MSKRKLLLADDSMTIQKVVNLTFADEGIEVFTVGNGSLAIEKLSEVEPDLVLADVHMPGLSGYEVCEQIRANPQFKDIPVMLLVGSFEPFDEREAERVGANDYLTKPFQSIRQLIQKVTMLLDDPQSGKNGISEISIATEANNPAEIGDPSLPQDSDEVLLASSATAVDDSAITAAQSNEFETSNHEMSFSDTALDDEMIETSSGNNYDDNRLTPVTSAGFEKSDSGEIKVINTEPVGEVISEKAPTDEAQNARTTDEEMRPTEPLSFDDFQEMNIASETATQSETQDEWQPFELETDVATVETNDFGQNTSSNIWHQNESPAPQEEIFEITDFDISPAEDNDAVESKPETNFAFSSAAQSAQAAMTANEPLELDLDDINLLRIDDESENGLLDLQVEESPRPSATTTAFDLLPPEKTVSRNFSDSTNTALEQVGNQAVANLSLDFPPEVIEAIAQRVVEKLSDKVIEKIAWEIVPDRFDLIVRKHINDRDR